MKKQHTIILIIIAILLGGAYLYKDQTSLGAVTLENPQVISWDKPTTDAGWAEDVKKESFNIKSVGVLETMIETHTAKLVREELAFKKYQDCPQCIYYEFYEGFIQSGYTEAEAVAEANKQRDEAIANRLWSVEKLKQSVERMQVEIRLRGEGKVTRQIHD